MQSRTFQIHGLAQRCYFWGNSRNPKLVLLHGWLDTGAGFEFICRQLQKKFYCIAPDMRGYGKSGHTRNPLGYFFYEYVADLQALIEKLSPRGPVNLLGHSLGGIVASIYAGAFPDRLRRLVNVEGYMIPSRSAEVAPERIRTWIEQLHQKRFRVFPSLAAFAERLRRSNPHLTDERAIFLARYLAHRVARGWTMAADPKHKLIEPYWVPLEVHYAFWAKIQAPCLLISAARTEMATRFGAADFWDEVRERERHFPAGTRVEQIPDCGHMVHHEKPEALAEAILSFL